MVAAPQPALPPEPAPQPSPARQASVLAFPSASEARVGFRRCNEAGLAIVRRSEGLYLRPYVCPAGFWTIGWGATRGLDGRPVTAQTPIITQDQADQLLHRDLADSERAVARLLPVPLTDNQYSALVDFTFNLGSGALQRSTLRQLILRAEHASVPAELTKWVRGGGRVLPGLVARRRAEGALYAS